MVDFSKISPLDWSVPIVDPRTGLPSPQFIRLWQEMFGNTESNNEGLDGKVDKTTEVIAGSGLDGGGALSNDVTLSLEELAPDPSGSYTSAHQP